MSFGKQHDAEVGTQCLARGGPPGLLLDGGIDVWRLGVKKLESQSRPGCATYGVWLLRQLV